MHSARFWLQSDNTVKEVRNTYAARIISAMTQAGVWSTSSQNFLGVGHTHEDVDGVLSLCKAALDSASILYTPTDVINRLRDKLHTVFESRGVAFQVEQVATESCQVKVGFSGDIVGYLLDFAWYKYKVYIISLVICFFLQQG